MSAFTADCSVLCIFVLSKIFMEMVGTLLDNSIGDVIAHNGHFPIACMTLGVRKEWRKNNIQNRYWLFCYNYGAIVLCVWVFSVHDNYT